MGSFNRDYMQDEYNPREPSWGADTPATKWLLIATVVVFFLEGMTQKRAIPVENIASTVGAAQHTVHLAASRVVFAGQSHVEDWLTLDANSVLHGQIWRLVTYAFCHSWHSPINLLFNMIFLWYLGTTLERMYGSRELLWLYLTSAFVCGVIYTVIGLVVDLPMPLMGSNPSMMTLFTLCTIHFPTQEILFFWVIRVQMRLLWAIYVLFDLYYVVSAYAHQQSIGAFAYTALWNVGFAYLYWRYNWRLAALEDWVDFQKVQRSLRRATTARRLKVFQPDVNNLDEQVDAILAKIHDQGSESLTDRERAILQRASEQAKDRR